MAVVVSIMRGHDASYTMTDAAEASVITGQCGAGYLSTLEMCGEAAGTWRSRFGLAHRLISMGRVIIGFPKKTTARFSSRRAQITKPTLTLADQDEKVHGHAPDQPVLASIGRFANPVARRAKRPSALDLTMLSRGWERPSRVAELEAPRDIARTIWRASAPTGACSDTDAELARKAGWLASRGNSHTRKNVRS